MDIEEKYKISKSASIFTTEAVAIHETVKKILKIGIEKSVIFTDSLSVLTAIKKYSPVKSKNINYIILEIKKNLKRIEEQQKTIKLIWVPAHKGIIGNEKVDNLAKEASSSGIQLNIKLPYTDLFEELKRESNYRSEKILKEIVKTKGKKFFDKFYSPTRKPWFYKIISSRYHIVTINRLRANHYNLSESLHRKNMVISPRCECGYLEEDYEHIILDCPKYNIQRNTLFKKFKKANKQQEIKINIEEILKEPTTLKSKFITDYLKSCKLHI